MRRLPLILAAAAALLLVPANVDAAPKQAAQATTTKHKPAKKRIVVRRSHDYGFLPGYRPWVAEGKTRGRYYPQFPFEGYWPGAFWYRGHFTNGFGPCWTRTPIGPMWNCG